MKLLKTEPDPLIESTIKFMLKLDKNRRDEVFSYARFLNHQKELEQEKNQRLKIVKTEVRHEIN
jgi:hypothetical protein